MDAIDGVVLSLLAVADIFLIAYLRRRRSRAIRVQRMYRSLRQAVRRELTPQAA